MNPHDAADQESFFDAMYGGAMRAEVHAGHSEHHFSVAGHSVRLMIAGRGFADKLPTALGHLSRPPGEHRRSRSMRGMMYLQRHSCLDCCPATCPSCRCIASTTSGRATR